MSLMTPANVRAWAGDRARSKERRSLRARCVSPLIGLLTEENTTCLSSFLIA